MRGGVFRNHAPSPQPLSPEVGARGFRKGAGGARDYPMTRRLGIPLSGATGLVFVMPFLVGALFSRTAGGSLAISAVPTSAVSGKDNTAPRFVGAASCAAAGCHGANIPNHVVGSEYAVWSSRDPHARAYAVLEQQRSRDMVRRWRGRDEEPNAEPACLKCHGPLSAHLNSHDGSSEGDIVTDGVSCEACHGAAEKWLDVHYTNGWRRLTPDEKQGEGFLPTKNLAFRVGRCADCHVGRPGTAVDHDLIAAGHPRLAFEYTAYHELLPRHWEEKTYGKDFAARAWEIGQVVGARAAVDLLESRAREAGPSRSLPPEFAEYDCFACHHDLRAPSWRQERGYDGRTPGLPAWGTWSLPMAAILAKDGGLDPSVSAPHDLFDGLFGVMLRPHPASAEVADKAATVTARLKKWAEALRGAADPSAAGHKPLGRNEVRTFLLRLVGQARPMTPPRTGTRPPRRTWPWPPCTIRWRSWIRGTRRPTAAPPSSGCERPCVSRGGRRKVRWTALTVLHRPDSGPP